MKDDGVYVIVCATLREGVAQRTFLKLPPSRTIVVSSPADILHLKDIDTDKIKCVYVSISAPPDLMEKVDPYIYYLGFTVEKIH